MMTTRTEPFRIIQIEPATIETFRDSWPCSNLHDVHHVIIAIQDGNLIDLEAYADDDESEPIDIESIDGSGLSALIQDAEKNAKRNIQIPSMIHTGWTY